MDELAKLEEYIKSHGYKYDRIDESGHFFEEYERHQIIVYGEGGSRLFDAIWSRGSYGFEEGLLEVMGTFVINDPSYQVEGWLTAEEIIKRMEEASNENR